VFGPRPHGDALDEPQRVVEITKGKLTNECVPFSAPMTQRREEDRVGRALDRH
jgi:hypothetical protein